jgi:hypothetical protein
METDSKTYIVYCKKTEEGLKGGYHNSDLLAQHNTTRLFISDEVFRKHYQDYKGKPAWLTHDKSIRDENKPIGHIVDVFINNNGFYCSHTEATQMPDGKTYFKVLVIEDRLKEHGIDINYIHNNDSSTEYAVTKHSGTQLRDGEEGVLVVDEFRPTGIALGVQKGTGRNSTDAIIMNSMEAEKKNLDITNYNDKQSSLLNNSMTEKEKNELESSKEQKTSVENSAEEKKEEEKTVENAEQEVTEEKKEEKIENAEDDMMSSIVSEIKEIKEMLKSMMEAKTESETESEITNSISQRSQQGTLDIQLSGAGYTYDSAYDGLDV